MAFISEGLAAADTILASGWHSLQTRKWRARMVAVFAVISMGCLGYLRVGATDPLSALFPHMLAQ
jgi:hypothetical protein